jgi:hypothetical protein
LLLLICAPPDVRDERTQSTYLEWLSYPEAEMPRRPGLLHKAAATAGSNNE